MEILLFKIIFKMLQIYPNPTEIIIHLIENGFGGFASPNFIKIPIEKENEIFEKNAL